MKNRTFKIATLSDGYRLADPVTIITASIPLLTSLFPNLFGGSRVALTESDWLRLIPGNGYITTALRNFLKARIRYNEDLQKIDPGSGKSNLESFTIYFAQNQSMLWCPDGSCQGNVESILMPKFYAVLRKESSTAGLQPIGQVPGFISGFDGLNLQTVLLIGAGIFLIATMSKKSKAKK